METKRRGVEEHVLEGHTDKVKCISVNADGSLIVSGSDDMTVRVWKIRDGEWKSIALKGHTREVYFVWLSLNGMQIVSGYYDRTVRIWKMKDGDWDGTVLEDDIGFVKSVTGSADGSQSY